MKKYLLKHKVTLTLLLGVDFLVALLELWKAELCGILLDVASGTIAVSIKNLLWMVILFLICLMVVYISQGKIQCNFTKKCLTDIKNTLFGKLLDKDYQSYTKLDTTDYLSNLTNDINLLERDYFQSFYLLVESIFSFVIAFIAIMRQDVLFIVFILATFWIPMAVNRLMKDQMEKKKGIFSDSAARFTNHISDFLGGFEVIKLFSMEEKITIKYNVKNTQMEEARENSDGMDVICKTISGAASVGIWLGSMLLGVYLVMQGKMTAGEVIMVNQLQNNIVNPLNRLSIYHNKMSVMNTMLKRIEENYQVEKTEKGEDVSFLHEIVLSDVSLTLGDKQVLDHVNLTFEKGKKYALMGESGSGKTTILKLLMKYYENYTGEILVDGVSLRDIDHRSWMKTLNVVFQDVYMFQDSVKENIVLGREYEQSEFERTIDESCLGDVLNRLEKREETMLAEHGKNFSGGERQRIAIARAALKKKDILLLDEATSALDKESAELVVKNLLGTENQTVLAVLHKVTDTELGYFDEVIQMKNGKVVF